MGWFDRKDEINVRESSMCEGAGSGPTGQRSFLDPADALRRRRGFLNAGWIIPWESGPGLLSRPDT